jgi:hypothetical protein
VSAPQSEGIEQAPLPVDDIDELAEVGDEPELVPPPAPVRRLSS